MTYVSVPSWRSSESTSRHTNGKNSPSPSTNPMSVGRHTCRKTLRITSVVPTDYVWISDELVVKHFQRFATQHKRHGSSVPGPLEARKRLARRRNTSLASSTISGGPVDFGTIMGSASWNDNHWRAPGARVIVPPALPAGTYHALSFPTTSMADGIQ